MDDWDVLDVSLCDVELLGEVALTTHLIVAANESRGELTQQEIDGILFAS